MAERYADRSGSLMRALALQGKRLRVAGWIIAVMAPAFMVGSLWLSQTHRDGFITLFDDDGLIETAQALLYAAGSWLSLVMARRLWHAGSRVWPILYGVLAVGLFWVTGEEISWGQRLLGVSTPEWFMRHNVQREMTLHNLPGVTETIKKSLYRLLPVLAGVSAVLWGAGRPWARRLRLALWLPHPVLIPTWLSVVSYHWLRRWYYPSHKLVPFEFKRLAEAGEFLFALGVVVFLTMALRSVQRRGPDGSGDGLRS